MCEKPINIQRHIECAMYAGDKCPVFSDELSYGEVYRISSGDNYMLIFVNGPSEYVFEDSVPVEMTEPYFLFLGVGESINITIKANHVRLSSIYFDKPAKLCSTFAISNLKPYVPAEYKFTSLPINEPLRRTLESVVALYEDRLWCKNIMEMKLKEIFFVISAYYAPEDISQLLSPLLRREIDFKEFVHQNFLSCDTVQELADLRGQNVRKFKKEFMDVFGMPPYSWMLIEKAKFIDERLSDPTVSFAEIIKDFRFSSSSHFTVFCRRQFDMTPTQRRRMLIKDEAEKRAAARRAKYAHLMDTQQEKK